MTSSPLYLDYASTTPVAASVVEYMTQFLGADTCFANPASRSHMLGWQAEAAVENARRQVADLIGADPREIVWTSGATEANNLALKGCVSAFLANDRIAGPAELKDAEHSRQKIVVITSKVEHKAVLDTCAFIESALFARDAVTICYLDANRNGHVSSDDVARAVENYRTKFGQATRFIVSLMHVNNETGALTDIESVGNYCREQNIIFHVDAAQSAGKIPIDVTRFNIDLLSISAHKFYGPKGIGALFVRRSENVQVLAQIHGGGHERGMRSGTLATHQVVGIGAAAELASRSMNSDYEHLSGLRKRFVDGLMKHSGVSINCDPEVSFPGIVNVCFHGVDGETLMMSLRTLAISSGSACTSASVDPSYVLRAMGLSRADALSSLRFSFGRGSSLEDIDSVLVLIENSLRSLSGAEIPDHSRIKNISRL